MFHRYTLKTLEQVLSTCLSSVWCQQTDRLNSRLKVVFSPRMMICVMTGLRTRHACVTRIAGARLVALLQTSPAEIGLFSLVGLPYTWKFLWAPFMDRITPLPLGRRRGWMLLAQLGLIASIGTLGYLDPLSQTALVAVFASLIAFLSATQDVAIDAYRREILSDEELGLGNAIHVQAYRIAGLVPGSLSLILADVLPGVGFLDYRGIYFGGVSAVIDGD